jgi:CO/xanthine dehydrogenase FAD-binding subunit
MLTHANEHAWKNGPQSGQGWKHSMRYEAPKTFEEAVKLLAGATGEARVLAGGTDLLVQMRTGRIEPELVVDLKHIPATRTITEENGGFRIGAAVPCIELGTHAGIAQAWPGIADAARLIGSTQVQGRATVTGNLCNASPAADSVPAMVAAGAVATIAGPNGKRHAAVETIGSGPGRNSLAKGEIIESVFLPARPAHSGDCYLRFIPRTEMDIAVVGCGLALTLDGDGKVTAARVSLGAVAATVLLVEDAAKAIIGSTLDEAALDRLAEAATAAAKPIADKRGTVEFRKDIAGVLARRAAVIAYKRAQGHTVSAIHGHA